MGTSYLPDEDPEHRLRPAEIPTPVPAWNIVHLEAGIPKQAPEHIRVLLAIYLAPDPDDGRPDSELRYLALPPHLAEYLKDALNALLSNDTPEDVNEQH